MELLIQSNARTTTPAPFCFSRLDIVSGNSTPPTVGRVADELTPAQSVIFRLPGGLEICQESFSSWEALRVTFSARRFRIEELATWLQTWLDPEELREPDSFGLSGVVHDLAWSQLEPHQWQLDLDLGSAPLAALAAGATRLTISRHDQEDT